MWLDTLTRAAAGRQAYKRLQILRIFPSKHEELITIVIITFCVGFIVGLLPSLDGKTIMGAATTLIAAFVGAFFAFSLNERREKIRTEERHLGAANRAIFTLIRAYNYIAGYNKQYISPHKDKREAYVAIRPSVGNPNPEFKIDFDSISFLIQQKKSEILGELAEFEELFATIIEVLKTRNHIHANIVQPALEASGVVHGDDISLDEIDKIMGDRITNTMKSLTGDLIEIMGRGEERSEHLIQQLHETMVNLYPGKNVIHMKKLNKSSQQDARKSGVSA